MKVRSIVLVIALLLLALMGCARSSKDGELPVVRYLNFKVYDPTYVAIDKGFFAEEGIRVEVVGDTIAGPNAIQAVAGGSAEAGLSSIPALITANAAGLPVQGVVDIQTTFAHQPLQKWYVRSNSPIQQLEDVQTQAEKPVYCVNIWRSSFHTTSLMAFNQRDIPEDAVDWRLLSFADQVPALIQGECDIIGLMQPYQTFLEKEYGDQVRLLYDDYNDVYGEKHVSLIFVNRVWANAKPELATAFTNGVAKAIDWIATHQDEARAIEAKYTGIPVEAVPDYYFTEHGCVRPADITFWMDYLRQRGDITADWVTTEMVGVDTYNSMCRE